MRLAFTYSVSKNKEVIRTDKPTFGGLKVMTWLANSDFKNKTKAKGGKKEARTEDGANKARSGGLVDLAHQQRLQEVPGQEQGRGAGKLYI